MKRRSFILKIAAVAGLAALPGCPREFCGFEEVNPVTATDILRWNAEATGRAFQEALIYGTSRPVFYISPAMRKIVEGQLPFLIQEPRKWFGIPVIETEEIET